MAAKHFNIPPIPWGDPQQWETPDQLREGLIQIIGVIATLALFTLLSGIIAWALLEVGMSAGGPV